jgi:hypothetical protein
MPTVVDTGDEGQLVELVDVKDYVGIPQTDTSRDEKLDRYISAVTALIEQVTGPILPRVFDEWHDGGGTYLILRRRPSNGYGTTPIVRLLGCEEFRGAPATRSEWWPTLRSARRTASRPTRPASSRAGPPAAASPPSPRATRPSTSSTRPGRRRCPRTSTRARWRRSA